MTPDEYGNRYASEWTVCDDMNVIGLTVLHQAFLRKVWVYFDLIRNRVDFGSLE